MKGACTAVKKGSSYSINSLEKMRLLGDIVHACMLEYSIQYIFCIGTFGVGKTTLIRSIVESLPALEEFEITSPSFTTYNIYPTSPPSVHIDMYNTTMSLSYIMEEIEEGGNELIFVEWMDTIPLAFTSSALVLSIEHRGEELREVAISSLNIGAEYMLDIEQRIQKLYIL